MTGQVMNSEYESKLRTLVNHAWDQEIRWPEIEAWTNNFDGQVLDKAEEQLYGLFALSRFIYFGKRLVREMLKSLYRDYFASPLRQRIRRNFGGTSDAALIQRIYVQELSSTRFVGVGNPSESGAHLLYYFRQVNYLPKHLFVDLASAFSPTIEAGTLKYLPRDRSVSRYVFFDDLVGSGTQACRYLTSQLRRIRAASTGLELRFMSLFATTTGLQKLNDKPLFDGQAMCLFELDDSYRAFDPSSRYFSESPNWFDINELLKLATLYGDKLQPGYPLGYKDGQLLLGFSHNTPDNTLPIFWNEGTLIPWLPVFLRYDKIYEGNP
jgi:hypothetical protein